ARSGFVDRGQPGIQRLQARRVNSSSDLSGALFRSAHQKTRGEIRLGEMELARQPGKIKPAPLYARRHAVQVDGRYPQSSHGPKMWLHRDCLCWILNPQGFGGSTEH